ncbi:MAG: hypothetical protein N2444_09950 [Methylocystis sp.]|nr:hypothetical protein [Methylocystis sp.]
MTLTFADWTRQRRQSPQLWKFRTTGGGDEYSTVGVLAHRISPSRNGAAFS